jgi:hypothetical protein
MYQDAHMVCLAVNLSVVLSPKGLKFTSVAVKFGDDRGRKTEGSW